jgi:hypothetical protein
MSKIRTLYIFYADPSTYPTVNLDRQKVRETSKGNEPLEPFGYLTDKSGNVFLRDAPGSPSKVGHLDRLSVEGKEVSFYTFDRHVAFALLRAYRSGRRDGSHDVKSAVRAALKA